MKLSYVGEEVTARAISPDESRLCSWAFQGEYAYSKDCTSRAVVHVLRHGDKRNYRLCLAHFLAQLGLDSKS